MNLVDTAAKTIAKNKTSPAKTPVDKNATETKAGIKIPKPFNPTICLLKATKAATKGKSSSNTIVLTETPRLTAFFIPTFNGDSHTGPSISRSSATSILDLVSPMGATTDVVAPAT